MSLTASLLDDPRAAAALDPEATQRLEQMLAEVGSAPETVRVHMPAAARVVGRGALEADDPRGLAGPTLDDAVRGALLVALARATADDPDLLLGEVTDLYRYGDADEKRAVLRALHRLGLGPAAIPLVHDALRTNDIRLVAAALGPYAAEHLEPPVWRQGVLKCLFVGVPLATVSDLDRRADADLVRMVASYAEERRAAGRELPTDVWKVLDPSHDPNSQER
jgi:hypothetical protein